MAQILQISADQIKAPSADVLMSLACIMLWPDAATRHANVECNGSVLDDPGAFDEWAREHMDEWFAYGTQSGKLLIQAMSAKPDQRMALLRRLSEVPDTAAVPRWDSVSHLWAAHLLIGAEKQLLPCNADQFPYFVSLSEDFRVQMIEMNDPDLRLLLNPDEAWRVPNETLEAAAFYDFNPEDVET